MKQHTLPLETQSLFESLCTIEVLSQAYKEVKKNKGAPGIDGVTLDAFNTHLEEELAQLKQELESWSYKPKPVRRVEIAKLTGGVRKLGVPCVRDRIVQAGIKRLLEPLLEPQFSPHSYGFRPGRNQKQAVEAARKIVSTGKSYVADIDLSTFFDVINHDRLIAQVAHHVSDKRILRLIGMTLRSGVMKGSTYTPSRTGVVQGSPLSPLLSNLVLDRLDKELERRGLSFCRYADDCNLFVRSRKSAERVMESVSKYIEKTMKLKVNREKSQVARSEEIKFLGMTIVGSTIAISRKAIDHAMKQVKALTPRGTSQTIEGALDKINEWYVGWSSYYSMGQYPAQLNKIEAHIRRRLRSRIVSQQKRRRYLYNKLVKRGVNKRAANKAAFSNKKRWALSHTSAVERAYPNKWFEEMGFKTRSGDKLPHWFSVEKWVQLT